MLYPLRFKPFLKNYPYGGHRFAEILEIDVPVHQPLAETWEIADHGDEQSTVLNGLSPDRHFANSCLVFAASLSAPKFGTNTAIISRFW
jgi:mannose-6-phosphate isomerase class I